MAVQPSREWKLKKYRSSMYVPVFPSADDIRQTPEFVAACRKQKCKPTKRQARDYRRKIGRFATGAVPLVEGQLGFDKDA